jgi:hypothetical protein
VAPAVERAKRQPLARVAPGGLPREVRARVADASEDASVSAFRVGMGISALLVALGGILGLVGIRNPERKVKSEECPGGQLAGVPREGARQSPCDWHLELPAATPAEGRAGAGA